MNFNKKLANGELYLTNLLNKTMIILWRERQSREKKKKGYSSSDRPFWLHWLFGTSSPERPKSMMHVANEIWRLVDPIFLLISINAHADMPWYIIIHHIIFIFYFSFLILNFSSSYKKKKKIYTLLKYCTVLFNFRNKLRPIVYKNSIKISITIKYKKFSKK